jgi:hypothetical protein
MQMKVLSFRQEIGAEGLGDQSIFKRYRVVIVAENNPHAGRAEDC